MIMKILVPTDFSKNAQKAIDYAIEIASKLGAELILMHAYEVIHPTTSSSKRLFAEYNHNTVLKLHDELLSQQNRINKINPAIEVKIELLDNTAKKGIVEAGASADLIVMGTQGATGLKRIFMGSVTASVIGDAPVPVLAIPRSFKWEEPNNILLATNYFEFNKELLHPILILAKIFAASLHLVVFSDTDDDSEKEILQHKAMLENITMVLEEKMSTNKITSTHLVGTKLEQSLQQYINQHQIDILAMVTRKRNIMESIFNPSITRSMAYKTTVPLLAIPVTD
jgi:nucleotide-binding universal stress UspA family protein